MSPDLQKSKRFHEKRKNSFFDSDQYPQLAVVKVQKIKTGVSMKKEIPKAVGIIDA